LEIDLMDAERRILLYEKEVELVREQLNMKQDELMEEQNQFRQEKNVLMKKIADFTRLLAQRDEELTAIMSEKQQQKQQEATTTTPSPSDIQRQKQLEQEVDMLKRELRSKITALEKERELTAEIRKRYEDAQDALEFGQMNFEKERQSLQQLLEEERKQLQDLDRKNKESVKAFETTRKELMNKIKAEEKKLSDTKSLWSQTQEKLQQVEQKLQVTLQEKSATLVDTQRQLKAEQSEFTLEKQQLQRQIQDEQRKVEGAKKDLEKERKEFENAKSYLESVIQKEQRAVKDLQDKLTREQARYQAEKQALDAKITQVSTALTSIEDELAEERTQYSNEKKSLEEKLANEIRVGKLKKRQMKDRYDEIRKEMTFLWEGSKRQARRDEERLRTKYKEKLVTVKNQVQNLQKDLESAMTTQFELRTALETMKAEKERIVAQSKAMEAKYLDELEMRDNAIANLELDVATLQQIIVDKDRIIQTQNEQLTKYETSLREVIRLGLTVTGNKIKLVGRPFQRLIWNNSTSSSSWFTQEDDHQQ
jgi:chromosome segregation ATPase